MIDLLSPDSKTTTSTEPLGAVVLNKSQWKQLKAFIEKSGSRRIWQSQNSVKIRLVKKGLRESMRKNLRLLVLMTEHGVNMSAGGSTARPLDEWRQYAETGMPHNAKKHWMRVLES